MRITPLLAATVIITLACLNCPATAETKPPDACRAVVVLEDAFWRAGDPDNKGDVTLYLDRVRGRWWPVFTADAHRQSVSTHDGYIIDDSEEAGRHSLLVRVRMRRDKWQDIVAEAAWRVRFSVEGEQLKGDWEGVLHGQRAKGKLRGGIEPLATVPDFTPPKRGEHPRLLIRRAQIPALRDRAKTEWGAAHLEQLKADKSPVAQGMAYILTEDKSYAAVARQSIRRAIENNALHHTGIAHAPAFATVDLMIAYDLIHDTCGEDFHQFMRERLADKHHFFYWGVYNSQFNQKRTSNWGLMYRSALGLLAMSALDGDLSPREPIVRGPIPRLSPPAEFAALKDEPVVPLAADKPIDAWLFAGPIEEAPDADPIDDLKLADKDFKPVAAPHLNDGVVDLAALTKRTYRRACYLRATIDVPSEGYYQLTPPKGFKGIRQRMAYIGARPVPLGHVVHLQRGRYPLLVRIWTEPVGNWEPLQFSLAFAPLTEGEADTWLAERDVTGADAFCGGPDWRQAVTTRASHNLEALRWAALAAREAEGYFRKGLGDFGWNQEGEAYTRHAARLAMPMALCHRNAFGRDIPGADRLGMMAALATAATVYGEDRAMMQSFNVGGGPLDADLYTRAFAFVPDRLKPAVLWSWNRSLAMAEAGKLRDPHGVIAHHDGLSKAMRFINYPLDMREQNPADVLPHVVVDKQKGGYVFRNRWKDGDDIVVQVFANSNQAGGSWTSAQGGTFRITGLGHQWVVRGQGYGNGGSGRNLPDFCLYQNMVDVKEHFISGSPQAWTTRFAPSDRNDGSGTLSLNMDEIYIHHRKAQRGRGWRTLGREDLGIRANRAFAVDYSGQSGAPCLVAIGDLLKGTQGENTWQLATEAGHKVTIDGRTFTIAAPDGATLVGAVVQPSNAKIRVQPYQHVHEINYHGHHRRKPFKRQAVLVEGADRDQQFLIILTLQRGKAPKVTIEGKGNGRRATVGNVAVSFDGEKIEVAAHQQAPSRAPG